MDHRLYPRGSIFGGMGDIPTVLSNGQAGLSWWCVAGTNFTTTCTVHTVTTATIVHADAVAAHQNRGRLVLVRMRELCQL